MSGDADCSPTVAPVFFNGLRADERRQACCGAGGLASLERAEGAPEQAALALAEHDGTVAGG